MNPWTAIWVAPRQTIRQIIETNPKALVLLLATSAGAANAVMGVNSPKEGLGFLPSLGFSLVAGAVTGLLWLYICGWLYRWIGSWFGGTATTVNVRAAIAWVEVPTLYVFGLWLLLFILTMGHISQSDAPPAVRAFLLLVLVVVGIWRFVLACHTLGEVHGFSAWKGFGTLLIPNMLLIIPIVVAIAIPNVLRGRSVANEAAAIGNLRALGSSVEMFRAVEGGYPDEWQADLYDTPDPDFGPASFDLDLQRMPQTVLGYAYRYTPMPAGCAEPDCAAYTLTATPAEFGSSGLRSFFTDDSGVIRHCVGDEADASDPDVDSQAPAC